MTDGESGPQDPAVRIYRPETAKAATPTGTGSAVPEIGGRKDGTDPTRYGDWEKQGRCIDF
jgi:shikimate dehydrogenase